MFASMFLLTKLDTGFLVKAEHDLPSEEEINVLRQRFGKKCVQGGILSSALSRAGRNWRELHYRQLGRRLF